MLLPLLLAGNAEDNADAPMMEGIEPLEMSAHGGSAHYGDGRDGDLCDPVGKLG